jgi:hypothetical protein
VEYSPKGKVALVCGAGREASFFGEIDILINNTGGPPYHAWTGIHPCNVQCKVLMF